MQSLFFEHFSYIKFYIKNILSNLKLKVWSFAIFSSVQECKRSLWVLKEELCSLIAWAGRLCH